MELEHQTALITGGTARIGLEAARLPAREGPRWPAPAGRGKNAVTSPGEPGTRVRFIRRPRFGGFPPLM
jgi:NAD(P)-dependent dehydrogenase (short-subunit alcohol dehydrogenase family)